MTTTENTELAVHKPESLLTVIGRKYGMSGNDLHDLLQTQVFPSNQKASQQQIQQLLALALAYNLNPLNGEIWAYPKGRGIVPIVSVDGWYKLMNDHPAMDGYEVTPNFSENGDLIAYTATIWRSDRTHPHNVIELLTENKRPGKPWAEMPNRMLAHRALVQCIRKTFSYSGIYDKDEGAKIAEIEAEVIASNPALDKQEARLAPPEPEEKEEAPVDPDNAPEDLTYQPTQAPETTDSLYDDD